MTAVHHGAETSAAGHTHGLDGETPALRLLALLELIASKDGFVSLASLVAETGLPKPTVHRMLQQLDSGGWLVRQGDGRHFGTGARMRRLAEQSLLHATQHGARHAVLRELVDDLGEACNVTSLSGDEVLYLDRVETAEPLRFHLEAGSRVPVHASASGKMLLGQLKETQRRKLLMHSDLRAYTANTITSLKSFEEEMNRCTERGYAIDDEEYLPGLVCAAVLVPNSLGRSNLAIAVQAPVVRLSREAALKTVPRLKEAARRMEAIEEGGRSR